MKRLESKYKNSWQLVPAWKHIHVMEGNFHKYCWACDEIRKPVNLFHLMYALCGVIHTHKVPAVHRRLCDILNVTWLRGMTFLYPIASLYIPPHRSCMSHRRFQVVVHSTGAEQWYVVEQSVCHEMPGLILCISVCKWRWELVAWEQWLLATLAADWLLVSAESSASPEKLPGKPLSFTFALSTTS